MNNTYMFNLEGLIPKLCQLAREVGDDDRGCSVRSAALQALASMVIFFTENYSSICISISERQKSTLGNF